MTERCYSTSVKQAEQLLPERTAEQLRYTTLFQRGTLSLELYAPVDVDNQTPHEQDEVYVVISGSGKFFCDGETRSFGTNDIIFVAAKVEHRFLEFTEDFKTWVVFYGPNGGE